MNKLAQTAGLVTASLPFIPPRFFHGSVGNQGRLRLGLAGLRANPNRLAETGSVSTAAFRWVGERWAYRRTNPVVLCLSKAAIVPSLWPDIANRLAKVCRKVGQVTPSSLRPCTAGTKPPRAEVPLIQPRDWVFGWEYPRRPLPRIKPSQDRLRVLIQVSILHMTGLRVGQSQHTPSDATQATLVCSRCRAWSSPNKAGLVVPPQIQIVR